MFAAVVLAGGAAVRMGGGSKAERTVGGVALLDRVLAVVADASPRIVVGPPELALPSGVIRTRERPPGGGPVAALAAGLELLLDPAGAALIAILAADLPFLSPALLAALRAGAAGPGRDAAMLHDHAGQPQWLCGVWRCTSVRRRLAELGDPSGLSMRRFAARLGIEAVTYGVDPPAWFDCDTETDLRQAEEWADGQP